MSTTSHPVTRTEPTTDGSRHDGIPRLPVWQALLGAVAASATSWAALSPLAGVELTVSTGGGSRVVGIGSVVVSALAAALAALGLAALVRRFAARPRSAFLAVAATALVLSLFGPFGAATTAGAALGLCLLHLVVATSVVPLVAGRLLARRPA